MMSASEAQRRFYREGKELDSSRQNYGTNVQYVSRNGFEPFISK